MAMIEGNDNDLLSQGALGSPRDRQGGAPDATGSNVSGRESSEGTVGAAPAAKTATAEIDPLDVMSCDYTVTPTVNLPEETPAQAITVTQATGEKRKASSSPGSEVDGTEGVVVRRPLKARVLESTESPEARNISKDDELDDIEVVISSSDAETEMPAEEGQEMSSPLDNRVTRASTRRSGRVADFSQLTASRQKKMNKSGKNGDKESKDDTELKQMSTKKIARRPSSEFREEYIDTIVARIQEDEEESRSKDHTTRARRRRRSNSSRSREEDASSACDYSEHSSGSIVESSYCSSSKKSKKNTNKKSAINPTVKNLVQRSRKRNKIPVKVSKEDAEKELQYTRNDWLDMDPAVLGGRCIDHLAELDRQRSLCSNISGIVAGRMKDSGRIATEITKALIEKLTTVGDVITLKNENFSLKEELGEIKRREKAQNEEILTLRKMISNLEREVRSLKEGFGPFPASVPSLIQPELKMPKRLFTPEKRYEKKRKEDTMPSLHQQEVCPNMEVEPLLSDTPGCSTDAEYMDRKADWPQGRDSTP